MIQAVSYATTQILPSYMLTNSNSVALEAQAGSTSSLANPIVGGAVYLMHSAGSTPGERGLRLFGGRCEVIFALWDVWRYVVACVGVRRLMVLSNEVLSQPLEPEMKKGRGPFSFLNMRITTRKFRRGLYERGSSVQSKCHGQTSPSQ